MRGYGTLDSRKQFTEAIESSFLIEAAYEQLESQRGLNRDPSAWYVEPDMERNVLVYCGPWKPHRQRSRHLEMWSESSKFGKLADTGFWTNGAALLWDRDGYFPQGEAIDNEPFEKLAALDAGDAIQSLLMLYDPFIWHYPVVCADSFGLRAYYDVRYLDLIHTMYGGGVWQMEALTKALLFRTVALRAVILPLSIPEAGLKRIAYLRAKREEKCAS